MKKIFLIYFPFLLCQFCFGQNIDSLNLVNRIDTVIINVNSLINQKRYDQAINLIDSVKQLAVNHLSKNSITYARACYKLGYIEHKRGSLSIAEDAYCEAIAIFEQFDENAHSDYPLLLSNYAVLLKSKGLIQEVEKLFIKSIAILKQMSNIGPEKIAVITRNLAKIYEESSNWEKAEFEYLESISFYKKAYGSEHQETIATLINLSRLYYQIKNFESSIKFYKESISLCEATNTTLSSNYINGLNGLANSYLSIGKTKLADSLFMVVNSILHQTNSTESIEYAGNLINLSNIQVSLDNYLNAEQLLLKAYDLFTNKIKITNHRYFMACLTNLANVYFVIDDFTTAIKFGLKSIEVNKLINGELHVSNAAILNNLAEIYTKLGKYEEAEASYFASKKIIEHNFGKDHLEYIRNIATYAGYLEEIGNYKSAESLYNEALTRFKSKYNINDHPIYSKILNNLAILYQKTNNFLLAEKLYIEALECRRASLGQDHSLYGNALNNLGALYLEMHDFMSAQTYLEEARGILEKVFGKDHTEYAVCINSLGGCYAMAGKFDSTLIYYTEASKIWENVYGKENENYILSLMNIGNTFKSIKRNSEAAKMYAEASRLDKAIMKKRLLHLSEKELSNYLLKIEEYQSQILSFAHVDPENHENNQTCYNNIIYYKGFLLNELNRRRKIKPSDTIIQFKIQELKLYNKQLAINYSKPISERKNILELESRINEIEKSIAGFMSLSYNTSEDLSFNEIKSRLKPYEIAIEFVHYNLYNVYKTDSIIYGALILSPRNNYIAFIPLFEENQLVSILNKNSGKSLISDIYTSRGAVPTNTINHVELYNLIWKPIEGYLKGIRSIYYSSAGLLHKINLSALPITNSISEINTIADVYNLIELGSTRQIIDESFGNKLNNSIILYGGIQFDVDTTMVNSLKDVSSRSFNQLKLNNLNNTSHGVTWSYLDGTVNEVLAIKDIAEKSKFQIELKTGTNASEESFKNIGTNNYLSPRVLHMATHGYFFPDVKQKDKDSIINSQSEPVFKISDHPMLRSGLIMAGGNAAWQGKQTLEGREDGVLTAYEISQMNLSNTELVVLSACETGLGDIQGNEGVYGLQRAFKIAGVKYLLMSLWQVPDKQTSLLMTTFYKKWLEEKKNIPEAFHAAQKKLRDDGWEPYYWAGFKIVE